MAVRANSVESGLPGSVDRCPGRAAIYNHPCSLPPSLSLTLLPSSSVSLLHLRFQPMPPFDVGSVSLCYLASLQPASSLFEIYLFGPVLLPFFSLEIHFIIKKIKYLVHGEKYKIHVLSSACDIDLKDSMANKCKWTVPTPLVTVQTQD